jgi:hypothetical protein
MGAAIKKATGAAGRCYWTANRWLEYGKDIHRVIEAVGIVLAQLPPTIGWRAPDCDSLLKVERALGCSLVAMEDVILEHFGGRWEDVPAPVARFPQHWVTHPLVPHRTWPRRPEPTSREEWGRFGDLIKEAKCTLQRCYVTWTNECRGRTRKRHIVWLNKALRAIDKANCRLDSLVCNQHPDWTEAIRIFYGAHGEPR